jgi:hypothetical protein
VLVVVIILALVFGIPYVANQRPDRSPAAEETRGAR